MIRTPACLLLTLLLTACGGGSAGTPVVPDEPDRPVEPAPPDEPGEPERPVEPAPEPPGGPAEPPLDPEPPPPPPLTQQERWLNAVNAFRSAERLCTGENTVYAAAPALRWDGNLELAAIAHSADMAAHDFLGHVGSDGSHFSTRAFRAGYHGFPVAENVAAGSRAFEDTLDQWIDSESGHCRHLMRPDVSDVGIGTAFDAASTYGHYWTYITGIGGT